MKYIDEWMTINKLKLDKSKTELIVTVITQLSTLNRDGSISTRSWWCLQFECSSKYWCHLFVETVKSLKSKLQPMWKNDVLQMHRQITCIRRFLSDGSVKTLVHEFVKCGLDTCHYYTRENLIQKLQIIVQNCAARLIMKGRKWYVTTSPRYYENLTGSGLTNALCLKFCFSPIQLCIT